MDDAEDEALRSECERLLSTGLETRWRERAYSSEAVNEVVARLQAHAGEGLATRLAIAGVTLKPYVSKEEDLVQACESCMYYVIHRRFCELPELQLPVKPAWSCRLWRI